METQEFDRLLQEKTEEIEKILRDFLPKEEGVQKTVLQAMNYSVLAGGKRLRPMLMLETYRMCGGQGKEIEAFAAAIEMIHTYSLVHDDLPAMDNDSYRRGCETTWKVYGEAMGILAGDGLLNFAVETALKAFERVDLSDREAAQRIVSALTVLFAKAGVYGMIGGQTADVEAQGGGTPVTEELLNFIHHHKTGALMVASMKVGAILAGVSEKQLKAIEHCAEKIGMAFQIQDDILDVVGDSKELGKPVGSDAQNHKQTYVTLYGIEKAKKLVEELSEEAVETHLKSIDGEREFLEKLLLTLVHRCR